jgi:hypothetical protein
VTLVGQAKAAMATSIGAMVPAGQNTPGGAAPKQRLPAALPSLQDGV